MASKKRISMQDGASTKSKKPKLNHRSETTIPETKKTVETTREDTVETYKCDYDKPIEIIIKDLAEKTLQVFEYILKHGSLIAQDHIKKLSHIKMSGLFHQFSLVSGFDQETVNNMLRLKTDVNFPPGTMMQVSSLTDTLKTSDDAIVTYMEIACGYLSNHAMNRSMFHQYIAIFRWLLLVELYSSVVREHLVKCLFRK